MSVIKEISDSVDTQLNQREEAKPVKKKTKSQSKTSPLLNDSIKKKGPTSKPKMIESDEPKQTVVENLNQSNESSISNRIPPKIKSPELVTLSHKLEDKYPSTQ